MPMKRLMHDRETYAVLGTLNTYDIGYIMGVTDQLFHKKKAEGYFKIFIQVRFIETAFLSSDTFSTSFFECMNNSDSVKICFLIRNQKTFIFRIKGLCWSVWFGFTLEDSLSWGESERHLALDCTADVIEGQVSTLGNGSMNKTLTNHPSNLSVGSTYDPSSLSMYC